MNIAHIVGNKFNWKNTSNHRMLTTKPSEGVIASGYARKNLSSGSNYNFITKEYHGLLLLSGEGIYKDKAHEIKLKAGDFIQRLPDVPHSTISTDNNWAELYVVIGKPLFESLSNINVLTKSSPVLHPGIDYEMIQSILHFHDQLGFVDRLELPLLIPQVISYLARINYLDKVNQPSTHEKDILSLSTAYIQENLNRRLTVEEIAAHVNMGYEKFRKLFTHHYNISPGNYIIHKRIHQSQNLLSNSDISIKEIALLLGYVDTYTFSKQFKKITGRSPSDFKQLFFQ